MEQIRRRAREGLMAAPRVGMGVGGLLLGVRKGSQIRLLDSIDISCSHSIGPSIDLTPDERRKSLAIIAEAENPGVSRKVSVIGWYCSKIRGDANLNQSDLSLYDELFPDPWQVALVVRPSVVDEMRATFFFRDEHGAVAKAIEFDVDEWRPPKVELKAAEPVSDQMSTVPELGEAMPAEVPELRSKPAVPKPVVPKLAVVKAAAPKVVEITLPAPKPVGTSTRLSDIVELSATGPDERPVGGAVRVSAVPFATPGFLPLNPGRPNKARLPLLIAAAVLAGGTLAFFTQDYWMPKPPLTLNSTESNGTLLIRWNPDALRGVDHASLFVNDGGQPAPSLIPLDRLQLNSGLLSYTPKSQRVTVKLDAGETSAITAWFAPVMPAPVTPAPVTSAPVTPAPITPAPVAPAPAARPSPSSDK
jgi:hypothetical protein